MSAQAFSERLVPGWWVFALGFSFIGMVAVAYAAVLGIGFGLMTFTLGCVLLSLLLVVTSPTIRVDASGVCAGRARLPLDAISRATLLDSQALRAARGPNADALAFTLLRPSRSRVGVRLTIADSGDPHSCWVLSSRRPEHLIAALECCHVD